jgi:DNA modification methylase
MGGDVRLFLGDCREWLPEIPTASVDCVVCDPPYPYIKREYGYWTEDEWWDLMMAVCREIRRILTPTGSAVFILQPNSERAGKMRLWLWDFVSWAGRAWNLVQDVYWWNTSTLPVGGSNTKGLLRPSLKMCVWLGDPSCYRNQDDVLLEESASNRRDRKAENFADMDAPSRRRSATEGPRDNHRRLRMRCVERGGTTPFNVLPFGSSSPTSGGVYGHGAATPADLCDWWIRYLCPPGGTVCDPFLGSGTTALAALNLGRSFVGGEQHEPYYRLVERRIAAARAATPLLMGTT